MKSDGFKSPWAAPLQVRVVFLFGGREIVLGDGTAVPAEAWGGEGGAGFRGSGGGGGGGGGGVAGGGRGCGCRP